MKIKLFTILAFLLCFGYVSCQEKNPIVEFQTSKGNILLELDIKNAPITAGNFLKLVKEGAYDGSSFYRTVRGEDQGNPVNITVVQGGISRKRDGVRVKAISHESTKVTGLSHSDGVISMARSRPGTASSEFFFCLGNNPELDFGGKRNTDGQGFAAFGKVIKGLKTVKDIWEAPAKGETLNPAINIVKIIVK